MKIDINIRHKGYTLIEILIVLALLFIFLSIAVPKTNLFNRMKEQQELREFKRDILYARNKAIVESKICNFNFDYENNSYNISIADGEIIKSYKFQYGIKVLRNPSLPRFTFTRSGAPGKTGTVYLLDSRNSKYKLTVAPSTGKISLNIE